MNDRSPPGVLVTGVSEEDGLRLSEALTRAGYDVRCEPWSESVTLLVEGTTFAVIIVGHPLPGAAFGQLLSSVRAKASACRRSGLLILAPTGDVPAIERLIGRGVNRVVPATAAIEELLQVVAGLVNVAPRHHLRLPVQLEVKIASRDLKALCQTENISESGMLLRGLRQHPPGTVFSFEIAIPGENITITGTAEIARNTDLQREKTKGVGVRFIDLDSSGLGRLETLLANHDEGDNVN